MNLQALHQLKFFPNLKSLKIRLENHDGIDFLSKLDNSFCKRIEELWLDTKAAYGKDQESEYANAVTNALAKFGNLKSINLITSSADFDAKRLFTACQHLNDLHIRRRALISSISSNILYMK